MSRPKKNPDTIELECEFCNEKFTVKYSKRNQRFCSKKCSNHSPSTISKMIKSQTKTFEEKYDGHPMNTESTKLKFKNTMNEKYGVDSALQNKNIVESLKNKNLEKYGVEWTFQLPEVKEKIKNTCIEKYGVDNIRKSDSYKTKYKETCLSKYGVDHSSKSHSFKETHKISMFNKFLNDDRFKNFTIDFDIHDYEGVTPKFNKKYNFICNRCNASISVFINNGKYPKCDVCDKQISSFQQEIVNFIRLIGGDNNTLIVNDRDILYPQEIDIYIPQNKIGIECDSLSFHSEVFGQKNKNYHLDKTKKSSVKGISLIHIWDSEWKYKNDIVKSILRNLLNKSEFTYYARKCEVREINRDVCKKFLIENHIQGNDKSNIKFGLYYDNELISVMTFCKSRFNKKIQWEMSRFCNKINTNIVGGASKLFKHFIKTYNPISVISYSDRRYFNGNVYINLGFNFVDNTPPNYHYIVDSYNTTQNRMGWQKHKLKDRLENFDSNISEWENMKNHGIDRIWDCGNSKWIWISN